MFVPLRAAALATLLAPLIGSGAALAGDPPADRVEPMARKRIAAMKLQLNGSWVQKGYADSLRTHHSPFRAYEMLSGVTDLQYLGLLDSVTVGWNNHEVLGGHARVDLAWTDSLSARWSTHLGAWRAETDAESFRLEPGSSDTLLSCIGKDGRWSLAKISPKTTMRLESWVRQVVFGGRFTLQDTAGRFVSHDVGFSADGTVTGFPGYDRYTVWTDFNDDVPRMDLLLLEADKGARRAWYTWERTPATITLYRLSDAIPSAASTPADVEFELTRLTDPNGGFGNQAR